MPETSKNYDSEIVRKFIQYGLAYAELNEYFSKEFYNECYSSCEIYHHCMPKRIIVRIAPPPRDADHVSKTRVRQISSLVAMRLGIEEHELQLVIELVKKKSLCPQIHATQIAQKLAANIPVRRAVYAAIRAIREEQTLGCQIIVSGKTKGQRAKSLKFTDGVILHTGHPVVDYTRSGFTSIKLKQGILGIKVKIVLKHDPEGILGPSKQLPDKIHVFEPKD